MTSESALYYTIQALIREYLSRLSVAILQNQEYEIRTSKGGRSEEIFEAGRRQGRIEGFRYGTLHAKTGKTAVTKAEVVMRKKNQTGDVICFEEANSFHRGDKTCIELSIPKSTLMAMGWKEGKYLSVYLDAEDLFIND